MSEASRCINESWDLETVLQRVADGARSLTGARYGAAGVIDGSGRVRNFTASHELPQTGSSPRDSELLGYLKEIREPLRLPDYARYSHSGGFLADHPSTRPSLSAPIRHLGEPVGNIYLTEKEGGEEFSKEDEETLIMFASQAAVAVGNALRYQNEQRARVELETEKRRLEALVESSPVGVLVVDADTRTFALANHEAAVYRRTDGREYESDDRPLARALGRGEVVRAEEILLVRPDGLKVTTLVNATPIYSDEGEIVSAVAVIQDMTPLEEIERLRNEFLAMVSHELRAPLATITGCTGIVLGSSGLLSMSEILQYFRMIDQQSNHLRGLVNNLLDMTRIEAGVLSITPKPTDVKVLVNEAISAFLRRGARNAVDVDLPEDLPLISADGARITQVLDNLLSNASKYSAGLSKISVTASLDGFFVVVTVADEGVGIPTEQLTRLFEKYSRIEDGESERRVAGEGLGLAICKGIVEAHEGRIWAENRVDEPGTRINFTVPAAAEPVRETRGDAADATSGAQYRILAIDDEPQMLWLFRNIFTEQGFKLIATGDPDEMMRLLETERPDLVLLDLMMPGTGGLELMGRIREVSEVPIIFVSADDQEENVVRALAMGADDYIVKPFSPTELTARVASSLRKRRSAASPETREPYKFGDLTVDYASRAGLVSGSPVKLSATEYKLLFELSTNAGRTLTHDQILNRVWGPGYSGEVDLLRSTVKNLRRKLGDDARDPRYLFTEPRVGYRMAKS